jgi:hypothetical protein
MFRGIVPAIGGIDLSPMLGFFLLNFLRGVLMCVLLGIVLLVFLLALSPVTTLSCCRFARDNPRLC